METGENAHPADDAPTTAPPPPNADDASPPQPATAKTESTPPSDLGSGARRRARRACTSIYASQPTHETDPSGRPVRGAELASREADIERLKRPPDLFTKPLPPPKRPAKGEAKAAKTAKTAGGGAEGAKRKRASLPGPETPRLAAPPPPVAYDVKVNGQTIHYVDNGASGPSQSAPAVVLVHGFMMDHTMFDPQIAALAKAGFRVIALDTRCFGLTPYDGETFTFWYVFARAYKVTREVFSRTEVFCLELFSRRDVARDVLALMKRLRVRSATLVGFSQGGFIALRAALLDQKRVRAIVLIGSASDLDDPDATSKYWEMTNAWYENGPVTSVTDALARIIIGDASAAAPWVHKWRTHNRDTLRAASACLLSREDITARMQEITCPVMAVHGDADVAIDVRRVRSFVRSLYTFDRSIAPPPFVSTDRGTNPSFSYGIAHCHPSVARRKRRRRFAAGSRCASSRARATRAR
jgi:pimeloyl-ACP methyl ester carboxylesterase